MLANGCTVHSLSQVIFAESSSSNMRHVVGICKDKILATNAYQLLRLKFPSFLKKKPKQIKF